MMTLWTGFKQQISDNKIGPNEEEDEMVSSANRNIGKKIENFTGVQFYQFKNLIPSLLNKLSPSHKQKFRKE